MARAAKALAQLAPVVVTINCPLEADWVDMNAFVADRDYELVDVGVVWSTASSSGTLMLDRLQGTENEGAGDDLLTATVDLSATANTVTRPTLTTTLEHRNIYRSNRIGLDFGGTVTSGIGLVITLVLVPFSNLRAY